MFGEGIKRNLKSEELTLLQTEQNTDLIAALFKKNDKYIKVVWKIFNPINTIEIQNSHDSNIVFSEEKKGNIVFQSADYIIHLHDKNKPINQDEYEEKEYRINSELYITDEFMNTLSLKGKNILAFEKYVSDKQK